MDIKDKKFLDWDAIGNRVKSLIIERDGSIYALCEAINYDKSGFSKFLRGKTIVGADVIAKISYRYKVSTDYIYFGNETSIEKEQTKIIVDLKKQIEEYKNTIKTLKESMVLLLGDTKNIEVGTLVSTLEKHIDK
jgi:transcriptional regulator with XRE-family HTH domain